MGSHKKFESSDDSDEGTRKTVDKKKQKDSREKSREIGPRKEKHGLESDEETREKKPRKEREEKEERKHKHREEDKSREKDRQRREERSGGGGDHRRDRNDYRGGDRRRDWNDRGGNSDRRRDNERRRRDDGGKQWDNKLSQDEISRQRKMLWSKPNEKQEASSSNEEISKTETEPAPTDKKATQWASSIAAAGVSGAQSNKFLKLLGIKKTPQETMSTEDLQKEKQRQQKMLTDLDKQYQVARESTHMGKGMGLGFH